MSNFILTTLGCDFIIFQFMLILSACTRGIHVLCEGFDLSLLTTLGLIQKATNVRGN